MCKKGLAAAGKSICTEESDITPGKKSACVKNLSGEESIECSRIVRTHKTQNHAECFVFVVPVVRPEVPQEGKPDSAAVEDVSPLRATMSEHSGPERGRLPGRPTE